MSRHGTSHPQIVRYDDYVRNHDWRRIGWLNEFGPLRWVGGVET